MRDWICDFLLELPATLFGVVIVLTTLVGVSLFGIGFYQLVGVIK